MNFLEAHAWEKTYGESYEKWRKERWSSSPIETMQFLEHLLPRGTVQGEKRLLPHQAEALQRIIYSFEHTELTPLLATLATGTGKTVVIASVIAWLACRENIVSTFLLLCPNTIVRDRLRRDFSSLQIFTEFKLFPPQYRQKLDSLSCTIVEGFQNCTNLLGKDIVVANRHQFQRGYSGGNDHLNFLQNEGGDLAVFNDEAHNTRGREYARSLSLLKAQTKFRLDVTATPDRADNLRPQSHEIYKLSVVEAITGSYRTNSYIDSSYSSYPRLIKDVVVQRPSPKKLEVVQLQELTFHPKDNPQQSFTVREIDWENWEKQKSLQLVMDPGGMKLQLDLAVKALERKKEIAKHTYKPLLFVIAPSIAGAQKTVEMMREEFALNPLLVVGEIEDKRMDIAEKKKLRKEAAELGNPDSPYDSVVSVYMLREGWDVPEVAVMCLLRGFGSPLFAHQVLGRGLRLIRRNNIGEDSSIQELNVIDHPCLQLDSLWAEIDALVLEDEKMVREREISRDGDGEVGSFEKERREEQVVVRPDLLKLLKVPDPLTVEGITAERVLEMLDDCLQRLKDYRLEELIIVGTEGDHIERLRPQREKETVMKPFKVSVVPKDNEESREAAQKKLTEMLMKWADDCTEKYAPLATHYDTVYHAILLAFEQHLFRGQSVTEIEVQLLFGAQNAVVTIRETVTYELNHLIYTEEILRDV